jgi:hypothetical protein
MQSGLKLKHAATTSIQVQGSADQSLSIKGQPGLTFLQMLGLSCVALSCLPQNLTTNVSCSDPERCTTPQQFGDPDAPISKCTRDQLLPCFLKFADYAVPREDSSNMKCQPIMRKPVEQAQQDCAGSGPQQLGEQATNIPARPTDRMTARWDIDPSYYQYQTCECLLVSEACMCVGSFWCLAQGTAFRTPCVLCTFVGP